jgi:lysozyme
MSIWKWCLIKDDNTLAIGWNQVGDYWYFMEPNGAMKTGWYQDANSKWYYLKDNGQMATGWIQLEDKWYYLYETTNANQGEYIGTTAYSCTKTLADGKTYSFDDQGVWIKSQSLVSDTLIDFIKSFEGFSATPYFDEVNVKTLGYGMTGTEIEGINSVTEEQATQMLKDLINNKYAPVVKSDLDSKGVVLNQAEFDSLISFSYNCGTSALLGSTLYKNVCAGIKDAATITTNFQAWSNAGGQRLEGLYNRRTKEANIFLNSDYTGNC